MFDVVIKNGTVIDPSQNLNKKTNIFIKNGKIAEMSDTLPPDSEALKIINAEGYYVAPGFIDAHTHLNDGSSGNLGVEADLLCIPNGVTTAVDAGSAGIANFDGFLRGNVANQHTSVYALLHVSPYGIMLPPYEEFLDPDIIDEAEITQHFERHSDIIRGLKIRQSVGCSREFGIKPLEKTMQIAKNLKEKGYCCNVTVHFSDIGPLVEVDDVAKLLTEGDIFAHCYQTVGKTIFDSSGKIFPSIREARERGVLFDSSRGRIHSSIKNILNALEQDFYPDIISTDIIKGTIYRHPGVSLMYNLSLFYCLGMSLESLITAVTTTPAKAYGLEKEIGTLTPGNRGDVTIFNIIEQKVQFGDVYGGTLDGNNIFVPIAVVKNGRTLYERIENTFRGA